MRANERLALRQLYRFRCGYCGVRESDVGSELTVDHFQPESRGGSDEPGNWVYSCHACNEFKSNYWELDSTRRILHPLRDHLVTHLIEDVDGICKSLTETGAFHIEWLHLNRPQLVHYRRERQLLQAARQSETRVLQVLGELKERVQAAIEGLDAFLRS